MLITQDHRRLLRQARLDRQWTQGDLAERLGITNVYVCQIESDGGPVPTLRLLERWCDALGLDVAIIIGASRPRSGIRKDRTMTTQIDRRPCPDDEPIA